MVMIFVLMFVMSFSFAALQCRETGSVSVSVQNFVSELRGFPEKNEG
jgi:hypothetical protein